MVKDIKRFTDSVVLYDRNSEYATVQGYYAFIKAFVSHLAFTWYDSVPHYDMALKDMQRASRKKLMEDRTTDMSARRRPFNIIVPRYAYGLFEYPVTSVPIFPLNFIFEYSFARWATDNHVSFFRDDTEYLEDMYERKQGIVNYTMKQVDKDIIPRL